jgi:hypothetical protein
MVEKLGAADMAPLSHFAQAPKSPAVYLIVHGPTKRRYVGASVNARQRLAIHYRTLRGGTHPNRRMRDDAIAHGAATFSFRILATPGLRTLRQVEVEHSRHLRALDPVVGYNGRAGGILGAEGRLRHIEKRLLGRKYLLLPGVLLSDRIKADALVPWARGQLRSDRSL